MGNGLKVTVSQNTRLQTDTVKLTLASNTNDILWSTALAYHTAAATENNGNIVKQTVTTKVPVTTFVQTYTLR